MRWVNYITAIVCGGVGIFLLEPFMGQGPAIGLYLLIGAWHFLDDASKEYRS